MQVIDENGDPLDVGDTVQITVTVTAHGDDAPAWISLQHGNVNVAEDAEVLLDGAPVDARREGNLVIVEMPQVRDAVITYSGTVTGRDALMAVFAALNRTATGCANPGGRSGALLQLIGGNGKTPLCIDLADFASLQIMPGVPLRNTGAYRTANGQREDLLADDFIFCPEAPTVVHSAEFCAISHPGLRVSLAGAPAGGGTWEVDDFALFEVLRGEAVIAEGITTQRHPGGDTFWCGEIAQLMCTEGCVATLNRGETSIEPLAVVEATGGAARQHDDGAVTVHQLLPADEAPFNLRVTALDVGVEGAIQPGLYLVIESAE